MRGSTPCAHDGNRRYGGNTACVVVEARDSRPIMLDLGTGARFFGLTQPMDGTFSGATLLSHLHWDHVQGLPFFTPALVPGSQLDVYGPAQEGQTLEEAVRSFICPPYFPVEIEALPGSFRWVEAPTVEPFRIDEVEVRAVDVPHVGPTVGYRLDHGGTSIAYVSDHQQPGCETTVVDDAVLSLCQGVDLLIHDAQYTPSEFAMKHDWGHCTVEYAVEVAAQSGAKGLALFHHDPGRDDDAVDSLVGLAASLGARRGLTEVFAAAEGLTVTLGRSSDGRHRPA